MERFSVYWWDKDENQHVEIYLVHDLELAKFAVLRLTKGPAAQIGIIQRVIITDSADSIIFEWQFEKGVIHPVPQPPVACSGTKG
ncbi:hypothetical protein [Desulforamulus aeronauticus]|uniref:Uncharacterized protein n=1 Tax=Desulforamulus aeronauticus DSM 10349 TaxID=1121421 RepID=A0A1M6WEU9_9FIRM|nr:hypothetical protein [Desulforamulus aeronauticus]SHK92116.1 hypothetical protein SAMN02745123_03589 [Desulforamulus aeronauticus DSM 10349]